MIQVGIGDSCDPGAAPLFYAFAQQVIVTIIIIIIVVIIIIIIISVDVTVTIATIATSRFPLL